jgi:hypothetical protein
MNSQLAYEIGAVFLLAALLMFGTAQGFTGRFRLGSGAMVVLAVATAAFGVYHYWDQILALVAPTDAAAHVSAPVTPASTSPPAESAAAKHHSIRTPESAPTEKIIVVEEVLGERVNIPPASNVPHSKVEDRTPEADKPEAQSAPDPCEKSPYEGKARRALKSMGCGLHIIRRKDAQQP